MVITEYVNLGYSRHTILYQKLHHFSGEKLLIPPVPLLIYSIPADLLIDLLAIDYDGFELSKYFIVSQCYYMYC